MIHIINIAHAGVISSAPSIPQLLLNVFNFLLQTIGIIAIISLVVSGIIYLTSFGDNDRIEMAKKSMSYSVIGIVVVLSGMIIIRTISGFLK